MTSLPAPLDLAVVILNYNGGDLVSTVTQAALESTGVRIGVVVVDNGSIDGSADAAANMAAASGLGSATPFMLLRTGTNAGFAAGNNFGLAAFSARYLALLNNDAVVSSDTFARLVSFMDSTLKAGACAPRLRWPDGQAQPFSHGDDPSPQYLLRRAWARRGGRYVHRWDGATPRQVQWVAGTCMVLRAAALAEVGLLDENIFMYFEDNELCARLRDRGWQIYFVPDSGVTHYNVPSYRDRARLSNYYQGLARFYSRRYGRIAGSAVRIAASLRGVLMRISPRAR